ncbi:MAG TPA: hypothetical protein VM638_02270 [Actinomycetota bacterium]|nr:hypothetical protein [Actinomycetota bacterium]
MAYPATHLQEEQLLTRYLRGLVRTGGSAPDRSPGYQTRTCANCGQHTKFVLDPSGVWYSCSSCQRLA